MKDPTPLSLIRLEREIGLRAGLREFIPMAWPLVEPANEFVGNWHIDAVCEHLEAVSKNQISRLVINLPPGGMKSLSVCVMWPTWEWITRPGTAWMFASFDGELTKRDATKSLSLMQDKWFQARWGDSFKLPKDPPVKEFKNDKGGYRFATSIGGKATGRHVDIQVCDDPIKPQECTKVALDEAADWWGRTMASRRRDPKTFRRVIIMQRLHDRDLAGICINEGYTLLRLPMRHEPKFAWARDPRKEPGELLWPDRFPEQAVASLEKEMGPNVAAAQLQQRPVPEGGSVFRSEWWRHWTTPPARFDQQILSVDCAFKGKSDSDFVVIQLWGRVGPDYYLLDQIRGRWGFTETVQQLRAFAIKYPRAIVKLVEDKANGDAVVDALQKEISGLILVNPEGGKEARANACTGLFQAGNVYIPAKESAAWVPLFMSELEAFPKGANDDQVDCTSQALVWLHLRRTAFLAAMDRLNEDSV